MSDCNFYFIFCWKLKKLTMGNVIKIIKLAASTKELKYPIVTIVNALIQKTCLPSMDKATFFIKLKIQH